MGLSILGAILIGLSVITFFAANWNEISRGVKLGSLFVGMALSYGSGYYLWNRAGYGAYAVSLVLLGCIIYGAGVHLIGQIYHVDVDMTPTSRCSGSLAWRSWPTSPDRGR